MKNQLIINNNAYTAQSFSIKKFLDKNDSAVLIVDDISKITVNDNLNFAIIDKNKTNLIFSGDIKSITMIQNKKYRIFAMSKKARLDNKNIFQLRNQSVEKILSLIAFKAGVKFLSTGGNAQNVFMQMIPNFVASNTGHEAINSLKSLFKNFILFENPNGSITIGDASELPYATKVFDLPKSFFTDVSTIGATCPILFNMKLGMSMRIGQSGLKQINAIQYFDNYQMRIFYGDSIND